MNENMVLRRVFFNAGFNSRQLVLSADECREIKTHFEALAALEQRESRVTALAKDGGELFARMAEHLETSNARIAELEQQLAVSSQKARNFEEVAHGLNSENDTFKQQLAAERARVVKLLAMLDRHQVELCWGSPPISLAELIRARDGDDAFDSCRLPVEGE